jgi:hypothetical protein
MYRILRYSKKLPILVQQHLAHVLLAINDSLARASAVHPLGTLRRQLATDINVDAQHHGVMGISRVRVCLCVVPDSRKPDLAMLALLDMFLHGRGKALTSSNSIGDRYDRNGSIDWSHFWPSGARIHDSENRFELNPE